MSAIGTHRDTQGSDHGPAGQGAYAPDAAGWDRRFREDLALDAAFERHLLYKEIAIVAILVLLALLRERLL